MRRGLAGLGSAIVCALPATGWAYTALEAARVLEAPQVLATDRGELEGIEFWEEHDDLLTRAWRELGPRSPALYTYDTYYEERYVGSALREAAAKARNGDEAAAHGLFDEILPGVYASTQLFTQQFMDDLLGELEHIEHSGIPRRRPNGMNRHGVILDQVGLEAALSGLVAAYVRPLASMLFPWLMTEIDAEEHYAFTVRYEPSGDTELAKHGDASVVTLNLCLGRDGWEGGELRFYEDGMSGHYALPHGNESAGGGDIKFSTGMAVMHRGQHKHQALPLRMGERTNVIIWLMGRHGVVRIKPYPINEQLSASQRWATARDFSFEL